MLGTANGVVLADPDYTTPIEALVKTPWLSIIYKFFLGSNLIVMWVTVYSLKSPLNCTNSAESVRVTAFASLAFFLQWMAVENAFAFTSIYAV